MNILKSCTLCPRNCKINRYKQKGYCNATATLKIAHYSIHYWEEPIISGTKGSGTIFFSNCNMKCIYCQNKKISTNGYGKNTSIKRLSEICIELQNKNANNINLVTPTHYVPQIIKGIKQTKQKGLTIPIVYNTSSYENVNTIKLLKDTVDIYLADLRYYDDIYGIKYSKTPNYFEYATKAIKEMYNQVGNPIIKNNIMVKGLIVRVLIFPGLINEAKKIIKYLYDNYKDNIYISIMNQYTPLNKCKYSNLNRTLSNQEYEEIINYAMDLGIKKAFVQNGQTQSESFIPIFNKNLI